MKTQNNNQETSKSRISKSTLVASAVLFGAVLINLSGNAQDLWKEFSNSASYGKMALAMDGQLNETKNTDAAFEAINAEIADQLYFAHEMYIADAEAEETLEVESWMVEEANFTPTVDFNAVETEESMEVENWMTAEEFFNSTEVLESAEPTMKIEPWMIQESFFTKAEQYTANTADAEIAKYAEYIVNAIETEEALAIESWMTTEEYFNSSEIVASEESLEVEDWMLEAENFTHQYPHEQYAIK